MEVAHSSRDQIEPLEPRQLLTAELIGDVLTINGTPAADVFQLTQTKTNIFVAFDNQAAEAFDVTLIKKISVDVGNGNDLVVMQLSSGKNPVFLPAVIVGAGGNDTLRGGRGRDTIGGGSGNDILDGNTGVDSLFGGAGTDTADYSSRTATVTVSVDGEFNDGEFKEFDNVQTERVIGGKGNDLFIITPDDPGNEFFGGPGVDTIDYGRLTRLPITAMVVNLDDIQNDGSGGVDNIHSDIENIYGSTFDDSLTGSAADNIILGNDGFDTIMGGVGNDFLSGGADDDQMFGEGDDDFLINANFTTDDHPTDGDTVSGGPGVDFSEDDPPDDASTSGVETSIDPGDRDNLKGQSVSFAAAAGVITITGTAGPDRIIINQNATVISYVLNGVPTTMPSNGITKIIVECGGGNDFVVQSKGDGGNPVLVPTNVSGGNGNDTIKGGSNRDTLGGGNGNDLIVGNDGNDSMVGGLGKDNLQAGAGNDIMVGDTSDPTALAADNFEGGPGNDTADYSTRSAALTISMDDNLANDGANAGAEGDNVHDDVENLLGGAGADTIAGNASANFLSGGAGADSLRGGAGLDKLVGGTGADTILGGADIDIMLMSDGTRDDFDGVLDAKGIVVGEFVNGDINTDNSLATNRKLGAAAT